MLYFIMFPFLLSCHLIISFITTHYLLTFATILLAPTLFSSLSLMPSAQFGLCHTELLPGEYVDSLKTYTTKHSTT